MLHIIGAGPAGISTAFYADKIGVDAISIYEISDYIGGMSRSWQHSQYILDTGPHIFHADDDDVIDDWLSVENHDFDYGFFRSCNLHPSFPDQLFDYPVSLESLEKCLPESVYSNIRLELSNINESTDCLSADTFSDFMNMKMGPTLAGLFFRDYPEKVWGMPTDKMLAEWAPQRIQLREKSSAFYNKKFVAVSRRGTGSFYQAIINKLRKNDRFRFAPSNGLAGLSIESSRVSALHFANGETVHVDKSDHVISTIPATVTAKMLGISLDLAFRGVLSQYLFYQTDNLLPMQYNWAYITDPSVKFNRITEPPSMSKNVAPSGRSFLCIETTYNFRERPLQPRADDQKRIAHWLSRSLNIDASLLISDLFTFNYEDYVYPIQSLGYRDQLAKYNSSLSGLQNFHSLGTGGEFHYSDMQIIFRKSNELIRSIYQTKGSSIPQIKTLNLSANIKKMPPLPNNSFQIKSGKSYLHHISSVSIPVIAEIGINHNGSMRLAKEMVSQAKKSGAHFAKFQYYAERSRITSNNHTQFLHETADDAELSLNEIFNRSHLSFENCKELLNFGASIEMPVFFTAFDCSSAKDLKLLGVDIIKTASMDANNLQLHKTIASLGFKLVIISSGMTTLDELRRSLDLYPRDTEIAIMSCRSSYPCSINDIDLGEINFLKESLSRSVGFSDHTIGLTASLLGVACGAEFLERHVTMSQSFVGPDNAMSITMADLEKLSYLTQDIHASKNNRRKIIHPVEQSTFNLQKKSLRYPANLKKGEIIHTTDFLAVAPPEGYNEFHASIELGNYMLRCDVKALEPINSSHLEHLRDY